MQPFCRLFLNLFLLLLPLAAWCQADSAVRSVWLDDVVISGNKKDELKSTLSQSVQVIPSFQIRQISPQNAADLIANSGRLAVQKSQQGGGSAVIRGFEANRIVLMIDGVRMNNLIYRGGHLQNLITIDPSVLEKIEIMYGPSSTNFGSDALGGVVHLLTRNPVLARDTGKSTFHGNAFVRFSSANMEKTGHFDVIAGGKKLGSFTSVTYSDFGDMRMGKNKNPFYDDDFGLREYYVKRYKQQDSMVENDDHLIQRHSAYSQYDILQKLLYRHNAETEVKLNLQFSNSSDIPRYDRLTEFSGGNLKYAEWYYGPQTRLLASLEAGHKQPAGGKGFDATRMGVSFQHVEESRHTRKFSSNNLDHRNEYVNVFAIDLDGFKAIGRHDLRFGFELQFDGLKSEAEREDIVTAATSGLDTRYPGGDNSMMSAALYYSDKFQINEKWVLNDGLRLGASRLRSVFTDTTFFPFPFDEVKQENIVYSGMLGLLFNASKRWQFASSISTGFRVPNVDDLSKVFESIAGRIIVPNPDLKPEKSVNLDLRAVTLIGNHARWENQVFYTLLWDAISLDASTFDGKDSIMYDGVASKVFSNKNKDKAYLTGFSTEFRYIGDHMNIDLSLTYTYGRIQDPGGDLPLDHVPPLYGKTGISWRGRHLQHEFFAVFNGWKPLKEYDRDGEDNAQYATPKGTPAWFTLNYHLNYTFDRLLSFQAGIDNILDTQYRTFASGINAPGHNVFFLARITF